MEYVYNLFIPLAAGKVGDFNGCAAFVCRYVGEFHKAAPQCCVVHVHVKREPVTQAVNKTAVHGIVYPSATAQFLATLLVLGYYRVAVFLYHAIAAGMDMGIVNPQTSVQYDDIPLQLRKVLEDVVLNRDADATERLIALAAELKEQAAGVQPAAAEAWREASLEERLKAALVKGMGDYLAQDLDEAVVKYGSAVDVIGGPLMDGMSHVGELFGAGIASVNWLAVGIVSGACFLCAAALFIFARTRTKKSA